MAKQTKKVQDDTQVKTSKHCEIFHLVKDKNKKIVITAGNSIISNKKFDTFQQAEDYLGTKPYEVILNTACLMFNLVQNEKNNIPAEETK